MQQQIHQDAFEHLRDVLGDLSQSQPKQAKYNAENRLQKVLEAMLCDPVFLPVQLTMPANVSNVPITENTENVDFTTIITSCISDGEEKQVSWKRNRSNADPFDDTGDEGQLSLDAIAGRSYESGGVNEPQDLPPFALPAKEGLKVTVYNPVSVNNIDIVSIVFNGYTVKDRAEVLLRFAKIRAEIEKEISLRYTPEPRNAVAKVDEFVNGYAETETPDSGEYRLIYGFRTDLKNAKVNLSKYTNAKYAKEYFPIWALCAETGNSITNYRWLKSPILLEPGETLKFGLLDTINGTTKATGSQIEIYESTL